MIALALSCETGEGARSDQGPDRLSPTLDPRCGPESPGTRDASRLERVLPFLSCESERERIAVTKEHRVWDPRLDRSLRSIQGFRMSSRTSKPLLHGSLKGISRTAASNESTDTDDAKNDANDNITGMTDKAPRPTSADQEHCAPRSTTSSQLARSAGPPAATEQISSEQATAKYRSTLKTSSSPLAPATVRVIQEGCGIF